MYHSDHCNKHLNILFILDKMFKNDECSVAEKNFKN
jgi:hypothetical protein